MKFTAEEYIQQVKSGKVDVCNYIHLAIERHERDLKELDQFYFDPNPAKKVIEFFSLLKHYQGKWAGKPIVLTPHQQFCYWLLFGWRRKDNGLRRFRTYYKEEARKNAKTTEAAGIGLYTMALDRENAPQVYTVATKEDQARICFDTAVKMVEQSPILYARFGITVKSIYDQKRGAFMRPLGSNSKKQDGFNPHCGIIDEYHEHPDDSMLNVIESGMGAREQPLIYIITTAGFNQSGACYKFRKVAVDVLKGIKKDETLLPIICTLDKDDDWKDPKNWYKSNPLLDVSVDMDFLKRRFQKALNEGGTKEVDFKTKNLNVWTQSSDTWVGDHIIIKNNHDTDPLDLEGRECYGGLDLGSTVDLNAFVLLFPNVGEFQAKVTGEDPETGEKFERWEMRPIHAVKKWVWIPDAKVKEYADDADWIDWCRDGLATKTPGDFVDHEYITNQIDEARKIYDIKSIAIDPYIARHYVVKILMDWGVTFTELRQGFLSLSAPTKELERMLKANELDLLNDPVMRYMFSNCIPMRDPAGNLKLSRESGTQKIDGIAALVDAVAEYMTPTESITPSVETW